MLMTELLNQIRPLMPMTISVLISVPPYVSTLHPHEKGRSAALYYYYCYCCGAVQHSIIITVTAVRKDTVQHSIIITVTAVAQCSTLLLLLLLL